MMAELAFVARRDKCTGPEKTGHEPGAQAPACNLSLRREVGGKPRSPALGELALSAKIYDLSSFSLWKNSSLL